MSVTIHDIAKLTGFNASTVSRALRQDPRISEPTAALILRTAEQLGYVMNLAARNLAEGRTGLVALIMNSPENRHQALPASAMNEALAANGYTLMILLHNGTRQSLSGCIAKLEQKICDAVVMIPPSEELFDPALIDRMNNLPMPLCFLDRWLEEVERPAVTTNVEVSIRGLMDCVLREKADGALLYQSANNSVARSRFSWAGRLLNARGIPWTGDPRNLNAFVKRSNVRTLAVFADSPWDPGNLPTLLSGVPQVKRCIGAMFDPWDNYPPDFYDRIFLCMQNFPEIGRCSAKLVLDMLHGRQPEMARTEIPPIKIIEFQGISPRKRKSGNFCNYKVHSCPVNIPPTEGRSERSRREGYSSYQGRG